jgi:hypothetical protein
VRPSVTSHAIFAAYRNKSKRSSTGKVWWWAQNWARTLADTAFSFRDVPTKSTEGGVVQSTPALMGGGTGAIFIKQVLPSHTMSTKSVRTTHYRIVATVKLPQMWRVRARGGDWRKEAKTVIQPTFVPAHPVEFTLGARGSLSTSSVVGKCVHEVPTVGSTQTRRWVPAASG